LPSMTVLLLLYLVGFALLHSVLASMWAKRLARQIFGSRVDPWYMIAFSVIALITILPLVGLVILNPGPLIYLIPSPWRWLMAAGQVTVGLWSLRAFLDAPHRFLIRSQLTPPQSTGARPLDLRGVYCYIRDPFLLSGVVIIWMTPFMTLNMLLLYVLTTIYLYLGSLHWESRLVAQFGIAYREYQQHVPRMFPRGRGGCWLPSESRF